MGIACLIIFLITSVMMMIGNACDKMVIKDTAYAQGIRDYEMQKLREEIDALKKKSF